ncbi:MAG: hypothetical protein DRQ47_09975 [Gammaproteobacteria bacterium]|nr:MAG: hypothetical protein DRQ47_09975 [Gammaproteobacteria bacterium]
MLVLALLILAACTNPLAKETPVKVVNSPVATQPAVPEVSDSILNSNMQCDMLKNSENRQNCETQINDMIGMILQEEITSSFDLKRCKELPSDIAERCESRLTESGVQGPVSDADKVIFNEAMRGTFPDITEENGEGETPFLFPVYDVVKCSQLKTPGYKAYCEKLITEQIEQDILEQIMQSDDASRCDELNSEDMITNCKQFFGVDIATEVGAVPVEVPPGLEVVQ